MTSKTTTTFSLEVRARAVRMVLDHRGEHASRNSPKTKVHYGDEAQSMTVTLGISLQIEAGLVALAEARGLALAQYVQRLLEKQIQGRTASIAIVGRGYRP